MRQITRLSGVLAAAFFLMVVAAVTAGAETVSTRLIGYQETPATINSTGSGEFTAKISKDGTAIDYTETYRDLSSPMPTQSHIHFGRPGLTGGIVLFLCTNLTPPVGPPTPQICPAGPATITGTLTSADVIAVPGQGIDPGAAGFAEMIKAIRAGAAYVNVHTTLHPSGETRGRLPARGHDNP